MKTVRSCIQTLEKLSLLDCSKDVLPLLERALQNVEPILKVDTGGKEASVWQSKLNIDNLHDDQINVRLTLKDLRRNAPGFCEDYITVGIKPKNES